MKKILPIIAIIAVLFSTPAIAQKKLTEGTISYDIVISTGSDRPQATGLSNGATSTVYLKGVRSRTEAVTSLGTQVTIIDPTKNSITILKEFGDQKYLINMTPADWQDANRKYENLSFTFYNDTKSIIGYTCKRAVAKLSDGTAFTIWYATDLVTENKDFQYFNKNLPGLAMQYESTMGNLKVTYTVSKISLDPVPVARFDIPRSGFRVMTYEESKGKS